RRAFEAQLALGAELGKPVVVHAREADADIAAMLAGTGATVVLHSFSSGATLFEAGMRIGAYFSFSGMITFKNWVSTVPLSDVPSDRLLVDTDAPYLAPVPHAEGPDRAGHGHQPHARRRGQAHRDRGRDPGPPQAREARRALHPRAIARAGVRGERGRGGRRLRAGRSHGGHQSPLHRGLP